MRFRNTSAGLLLLATVWVATFAPAQTRADGGPAPRAGVIAAIRFLGP